MNDMWRRQAGLETYERFRASLSPFQAWNRGKHDWDVVIPPFQTVSREAMLDTFLKLHPDFEPFRSELAGMYPILANFCVISSDWVQL
jgi:hypothetical protein